jgi:hypothetical protein
VGTAPLSAARFASSARGLLFDRSGGCGGHAEAVGDQAGVVGRAGQQSEVFDVRDGGDGRAGVTPAVRAGGDDPEPGDDGLGAADAVDAAPGGGCDLLGDVVGVVGRPGSRASAGHCGEHGNPTVGEVRLATVRAEHRAPDANLIEPGLSRPPLPGLGHRNGMVRAVGGSRTRNDQALDLTPLPVGLPRRAPGRIRTANLSTLNRAPLPVGLQGPAWDGRESNSQAEAAGLRPAGLTTCPTIPGVGTRPGQRVVRRAQEPSAGSAAIGADRRGRRTRDQGIGSVLAGQRLFGAVPGASGACPLRRRTSVPGL